MSTRPILESAQLTQPVQQAMARFHPDIVREVQEAIARERVVIIGMRGNQACSKARQLMQAHDVPFTYLEYGGYFSEWRRRLALKLWTGWPTFPMVFVRGTLVGGASDAKKAFEDGTIPALLAAP
ncbi:MAG: glutaredoxin [Deltaproteobacteria bacterium]|nr:glutaredoxin [Deltaproteobacteria bacterium]